MKKSTGGRELQDQDKTKAVREMEQDVSDCRGEREGNTGQLQGGNCARRDAVRAA